MAYTSHLLLWSFAVLCAVTAYWGPDLPPGPYCGLRADGCCKERQDRCSHRILDTLCYCDEFCNHTASHDDCCPDYAEVCLGILPDEPDEAPGFLIQPCKHAGQLFTPGQKREDDCNVCECLLKSDNLTTYWNCERDICVNSNEVIQGVNQASSGWRAYNYTQFQGKKLRDALVYKLGTLPLDAQTKNMGPMIYDKDILYPASFDARTKWPEYVTPVQDQGWCGSDWAVSLAGIVSDRLAIQSNGAEKSILSPQVLLSCNKRQLGCKGGHVDVAWNFARGHGLVEEHCLPYKAAVTTCPYRPRGSLKEDRCPPGNPLRTSRYKVGPPGRLRSEKDIMYDIMESGPVQAIMTVHQDLFHYRDGIYRKSRHGDNHLQGLHSVRIVGWGEDRGDKYWLVANSWGPEWGENGYFRIARGVNESDIESFVVTVLVDVTEALQGK